MKKILILTKIIPYNLNNGGAIRNFAWIKHLSKFFDIYLIGFSSTSEDLSGVGKFCKKIYAIPFPNIFIYLRSFFVSIFLGEPWIILKYFHPIYKDKIETLIKTINFSSILFLELAATQYAVNKREKIKVLYDAHNLESELFFRIVRYSHRYLKPILYWEALKIRKYEQNIVKKVDTIFFVSKHDQKKSIDKGGCESYVINNSFIDNNGFQENYNSYNLFFVGNLSWYPNKEGLIDFMKNYLPLLQQQDWFKKIKIYIMGSNRGSYLKKYLTKQIVYIKNPSELEKKEILSKGGIGFVPLNIGGGTRIKIIEYRSYGLPVLSTEVGAEGLERSKGTILYDSPETFIKNLNRLITKQSFFKECGQENYLCFTEHYDAEKIFKNLNLASFTSKSS